MRLAGVGQLTAHLLVPTLKWTRITLHLSVNSSIGAGLVWF